MLLLFLLLDIVLRLTVKTDSQTVLVLAPFEKPKLSAGETPWLALLCKGSGNVLGWVTEKHLIKFTSTEMSAYPS